MVIEGVNRIRNLGVIVDLCPWATRLVIEEDGDAAGPRVEARSGAIRKAYRLAESGPVLEDGRRA